MSAIAFDGVFHDGRAADAVPVRVVADDDGIALSDGTITGRVPRDGVVADAPIPGVPRSLRFADGSSLETSDHAAIATLWPTQSRIAQLAWALESRWAAVIASVAATAALAWLIVAVALPSAADPVAQRISPKVDDFLGQQTLATLDRAFLRRSELHPWEQDALREKFAALVAGEPRAFHYALEFRHFGAPNAFALPNGTIVVTDEMVRTVDSDDELRAVFAHEIGHVRGRHAVRLLLQRSGFAVLLAAVAGDAVGVTYLAAALPSMLLQSSYSREFETEADDYAFALLKRNGVSPQVFADMLRRLEASDPRVANDGDVGRYLSSHPATEERIRRAEAAAKLGQ
jgi:Zn-dependent protease with chaperone function